MAKDRAAVVTTTIFAIITDALLDWMHGGGLPNVRTRVEAVLREEFADLARVMSGERHIDN